ncbi:MAG: 50S ribosomal protein L17 [Candidatus Omnitrophica bacterium]|nr:50S ribosomal protein L17 [Candidatus Omnitrophota bacterium]MBI2173600.1 50S ribosomal protein L17 [Candidatus Omnitrophota bacterium]
MRHASNQQRLSRPTGHRQALLNNLLKSLVTHGQIRTTHARAKQAQRLADRLVTYGKDGSIHARRQAFRLLQNRSAVKLLFSDIAPRFLDVPGGYTRVVRLNYRRGDGAQEALLAFSRLPAAVAPKTQAAKQAPTAEPPQGKPKEGSKPEPSTEKPKGFLEGLQKLWTRKKKV